VLYLRTYQHRLDRPKSLLILPLLTLTMATRLKSTFREVASPIRGAILRRLFNGASSLLQVCFAFFFVTRDAVALATVHSRSQAVATTSRFGAMVLERRPTASESNIGLPADAQGTRPEDVQAERVRYALWMQRDFALQGTAFEFPVCVRHADREWQRGIIVFCANPSVARCGAPMPAGSSVDRGSSAPAVVLSEAYPDGFPVVNAFVSLPNSEMPGTVLLRSDNLDLILPSSIPIDVLGVHPA